MEIQMFDETFMYLIIGAMVLAPLLFVLKIVLVIWAARKAVESFAAQQRAVQDNVAALEMMARQSGDSSEWSSFLNAVHSMEATINRRAAQGGRQGAGRYPLQFQNAFLKAQNELNHINDLRRGMAEERLSAMKADAASMGLFI
jgi:hypothetical protein